MSYRRSGGYRRARNGKGGRKYSRQKQQYGYFGRAGGDVTTAMRMAGKALALLNVEEHVIDNTASHTNVTTGVVVQNLFGIAQGDDVANRQGNSIKTTQLHGRFEMVRNSGSSQGNSTIRIIIGVDHQCNGALPAAADVLAGGVDIHSMRNVNYGKRFTILMDERRCLDGVSKNSCLLEKHKKMDVHMEFKGTSGNISDISSNSFFIMLVSNEPTFGVQVNKFVRLRYLDN